ncbi:exonuclease, partial [Clostridium botulinum]|nr:exonuclease [Clostridium botulinum]
IEKEFHDAFNDAYYTAQIFKKLYTSKVKSSTYNNPYSKRISESKPKVDTKGLFRQFEKMYSKKLSEEEKKMIKVAYSMGRTNQFLKK